MRYLDGKMKLSVRELCAESLKRGDLDLRGGGASYLRRLEGSQIHRQIQSERESLYPDFQKEVFLTDAEELFGIVFEVSGRADCVFTEDGVRMIEELKTVAQHIPKCAYETHLYQLRTYAYFLCKHSGLDSIRLRITYIHPESSRHKSYDMDETLDNLKLYYEQLLYGILPRAKRYAARIDTMLPRVRENAKFPYPQLRNGQTELMTQCYRTFKKGKRLFAQAPTGIGKTLSVMYPAVRALSEGHCDKIFYLTAKASTGREAFSSARKLYENGAQLKTCVITARDQACICEAAKKNGRVSSYCNPDDCPYARGYYDKIMPAVFSLLDTKSGFSRSAIEETARMHEVCPYELALDLSEFCDIIICDYNYVFDPGVYLRRYFAPDAEECRSIFLIDEAHNLPDRARSMYSCELLRTDFERVYTATGNGEKELDTALEKVIMYLRSLRKLCRDNLVKTADGERGFYMTKNILPGMKEAMAAFSASADAWRRDKRDHELYSAVSELSSQAKKYLLIAEYYDERFLTYVELLGKETRVRVFCLDPSGVLSDRLKKSSSAVLFSATFAPLDYYTELCSGSDEAETLALPSPFPQENLCIAALDTISTRADDRDERACRKIAVCIAATVSAMAGNYICYFPSYAFMEKVKDCFTRKYREVEIVVQKRGMTHAEKEEFLNFFKDDTGILRIGFCVLGGSFSEGVDMPGNRLIGSIIVGTGIPGISNERNILKDYYDLKTDMRGYDYAYTYPGMNAVLQAAGRVIRRDTDKGIVVLIDDRYSSPLYASMFPHQWDSLQFAGNPTSLAEIARRFWKNVKR